MKLTDTLETLKQAWTEEYKRKGIPSSFRKDPSKTVVEFISWLKKERPLIQGQTAADIGCGLGRNSFYLASEGFKVTGIDLLEENARAINSEALTHNVSVEAFALDASNDWPIAPESLDIAIDVFCYKHIVNKQSQAKYRRQLENSLKASGFYFISLGSVHDGFYGPLLETSTNPVEKLIVDPHSNIPSFLYSMEDLTAEFSDSFKIIQIAEQASTSPMYGKEYSRRVINAILQKR